MISTGSGVDDSTCEVSRMLSFRVVPCDMTPPACLPPHQSSPLKGGLYVARSIAARSWLIGRSTGPEQLPFFLLRTCTAVGGVEVSR
jgi:hypothetical protein